MFLKVKWQEKYQNNQISDIKSTII